MKNKTYISPKCEIIEIGSKSCPLCSSGTQYYMNYGDVFSTGEQLSPRKGQESIWDEMSDE